MWVNNVIVGYRLELLPYIETLQIIPTNSKNNKHCKWAWLGLWGRASLDKSQTQLIIQVEDQKSI